MGYFTPGLCCIGALGGLSAQPTARLGNSLCMIGVTAGIASSIGQLQPTIEVLTQTSAMMIEITDLPQLVAAFNSMVSIAAVHLCFSTYLDHYSGLATDPTPPPPW